MCSDFVEALLVDHDRNFVYFDGRIVKQLSLTIIIKDYH